MTAEIEGFIRSEASLRGIDPQTAVDVAIAEGGVDEHAAHGSFPTGDSWWAYQLHYGGADYPQFGTPELSVAGMGNDFTALTAWPPGEEAAWRDACRFALNRAKEGGWGAWYGAAAIGITGFDGIDQGVAWDPNSQTWDYETGGGTVPEPEALPTYDQHFPAFAQNDDWSCAPTSARWALWAYGEDSTEAWVEGTMLAEGVVTTTYGLMDHTGAGLAAFLQRHYQEYGYAATNTSYVAFDEVAQEAANGQHPLMMGGQAWGHWSGVRGYDGTRLVLANPAPGWGGVTQHMSRDQFNALGKFSLVRLTHPAAEAIVPPDPGPGPDPADPYAPWRGAVGSGLLELMAQSGVLPAQRASTWYPLGVSPADVESCAAQDGSVFYWLLTTGRGYRQAPS